MNYSVCIDALYQGKDFLESMREVKDIGFTAFEFWSWWDKDIAAIAKLQEELGLTTAAMCTKFISLVDSSQHEYYLSGLKDSIEAAKKLKCRTLISQVGADTGESRQKQYQVLCDGVKKVVPVLEENNIMLVLEPLNTAVDHAGYYLSSSKEAFEIVDEIGSKNVKILFDIYHQQITEGDVTRTIQNNIQKIGHFHAAGNPGRHELDVGELNYPNIFQVIQDNDYNGYIGLEYFPLQPAKIGLEKLLK